MLLDEGEDAEDAADAAFAVAPVDRGAEGPDGVPGAHGPRQQGESGRGRPRGLVVRMNGVAPARLAAMLAQEHAGRGIEQADVVIVPLDGDLPPEPAGRGRVARAGDCN